MFERRFFVVAPSYHGATILSRLLNSHSDLVSLGDTYPSRNFDQICGCGSYVSKCPFWLNVMEAVSAERYIKEEALLPRYPRIMGCKVDGLIYNRFSPFLLKRFLKKKEITVYSDDYRKFLNVVYKHHAYKKPKVFVDGVKSISRVHALKLSGVSIDGIIHITRSPYDFVKSSEKQGKSLLKASIRYRMYHKEAERLRSQFPYIRVSYEELAESTDKTLERLFNFINVPVVGVDELKENFNDAWHFMGNASLLKFDGTMRLSTYNVEERIKNKIILLTGGQLSSVYL